VAISFTNIDGFELLAETLGEMVSRHAPDGSYTYASRVAKTLFGYEPEELLGRSAYEFVHPDDLEDVRGAHATLLSGGEVIVVRYRHLHKSGGHVESEATARAVRDATGALAEVIVVRRDLTERLAVERRAGLAQRVFEAAFHAAPHGVAIVGLDGSFVHVNQKLTEIVGYSAAELADITFQEITHPDDLGADLAQVDALLAAEIDSYELEKRYFTKAGHLIWVLLAVAIVREEDGSPRHFIAQVQDISERKRLEAHTYELANRDPITSLYNRRRFEEELRRAIAHSREGGEGTALLLLDLDRFKIVNDSGGHVAGDRLIRKVGRALDERVAAPGIAARIGGDEFAVILHNTDLAQAHALAEELRVAIATDTGGDCTVSIGLCPLLGDLPDAETCFRAVDRAMYRAKSQGRDQVVVGQVPERRA